MGYLFDQNERLWIQTCTQTYFDSHRFFREMDQESESEVSDTEACDDEFSGGARSGSGESDDEDDVTIKGEDYYEFKDEEVLTTAKDRINAPHEANLTTESEDNFCLAQDDDSLGLADEANLTTESKDNFCLAQDDDSLGLADDEAEDNMDEEDDDQNEPTSENAFYRPTQAYLRQAFSYW